MTDLSSCPDCGADWQNSVTCEDHFHQMVFWENENPQRGEVHHLAVLAYHLQHPHLYSPEGLVYGVELLVDFAEHGRSPRQVRLANQAEVDSRRRTWKIRPRPGAHTSYQYPVHWHMTAADVINAGANQYIASVQAWASSILADLRASGNLS